MPKAFLLTDLQVGFLREVPNGDELVLKIIKHLENSSYDAVFATVFINEHGSLDRRELGWEEMKETDLVERALHPRLENLPLIVIEKHGYGLKDTSDLSGYDEVHIAGIETDQCVLACALSLWENNIKPVVLSDLCLSASGDDAHKDALRILKRLIGKQNIISSYEAF